MKTTFYFTPPIVCKECGTVLEVNMMEDGKLQARHLYDFIHCSLSGKTYKVTPVEVELEEV